MSQSTGVNTRNSKGLAKQGDKCSRRPPYSPDLASSDFYLFGALKDALRGRHFVDDGELKRGVREKLRRFNSFMRPACGASRKGGKSVLIMKKIFWKKSSQLCKGCSHDVCKFYYNCDYSL